MLPVTDKDKNINNLSSANFICFYLFVKKLIAVRDKK
jgi:hypothetical protein